MHTIYVILADLHCNDRPYERGYIFTFVSTLPCLLFGSQSEHLHDPNDMEEYDSEYGIKRYMTAPKPTTYVAVAAAPSKKPARHFCNVCGYFGM